MKKYIITLSILFAALAMSAQEVIWKMTYDVAFPFSSTKEFTDQVSWRGLSLDVDRFVGDNLAVGFGFSWSTFVEKESDSSYERDLILLHGTQVRYINNIPLTARLSWYQPLDALELYGTLGVGAAWHELRREIGTFAFVGNYWQFAMTPEVGAVFPVGSSYLTAKVRYVMAFETDDAPDLSYLSVGLGFAW
ncbi:MAG: hypothetical protein KAR16_14095 [Bacteroidales bacterium]|nr:hypothetical protein [Bacteroidales bacterium]